MDVERFDRFHSACGLKHAEGHPGDVTALYTRPHGCTSSVSNKRLENVVDAMVTGVLASHLRRRATQCQRFPVP